MNHSVEDMLPKQMLNEDPHKIKDYLRPKRKQE